MTETLKVALAKWKIKVPSNGLEQLKAKKEWIHDTSHVQKMAKRLSMEKLYTVFNFEHHVASAFKLFHSFDSEETTAVVYGHISTKESLSFLFFLVKLLQELGEVVIYLDKSILPTIRNRNCDTRISQLS
jgi:hypothetical protein